MPDDDDCDAADNEVNERSNANADSMLMREISTRHTTLALVKSI